MTKNKHLKQEDRLIIEQRLNELIPFTHIAHELAKDPTTISKEIKRHLQFRQTGGYGRGFNQCLLRKNCTVQHLCGNKRCKRYCSFCRAHPCSELCSDFQKETCRKLLSPPYVCNGCTSKSLCTLEKRLYSAPKAQQEYKATLSQFRQGLQISLEERDRINAMLSPLVKQGQSLHHICLNHLDELMLSERTLYAYVHAGIFDARNLDMPRVVRMSKRRKNKSRLKVETTCRKGRTYRDFLDYLERNPDTPIVEMDTVEGIKGGKVLLTLHFTIPQFMLVFLRDANTAASVTEIVNWLHLTLGDRDFSRLFPLLLGDNGSEFSNPSALELDASGRYRTKVFYCDPCSPYQKGAIENNHTFLRRIVPKGIAFDSFSHQQISLMVNHINSYRRANLAGRSPYQVFSSLYGEHIVKKLGVDPIHNDSIVLRPTLLKK